MKKFLVLAAVLCCTFALFGAKLGYIQPTFGIGANFYHDNQFGITVGADVDWEVWEKASGGGAGKMYAGLDLAFQYWVPTHDGGEGNWKWHQMRLPLQGNFAYEFKVNAGPLEYVGPWYSMGVSLDFGAMSGDGAKEINDHTDHFKASFVYGIGASLAFTGNWALKAGFGGNHGPWWDDYFMVEAAYRF